MMNNPNSPGKWNSFILPMIIGIMFSVLGFAVGINAIQWVQGVGNDLPIMQWVPFIKKIQAAGKSVVVDLALDELEPFMDEVNPKGVFLCINADPVIQPDIIKKVERWK